MNVSTFPASQALLLLLLRLHAMWFGATLKHKQRRTNKGDVERKAISAPGKMLLLIS